MHRNIKPKHILLDRINLSSSHSVSSQIKNLNVHNVQYVKLSDFSISRKYVEGRTLTEDITSLWYRAPEIMMSKLNLFFNLV